MARLKTVTIVERRGGYVVEYRDHSGRRPRQWFATHKEALAEKSRIEKIFSMGPLAEDPAIAKSIKVTRLKDAIKEYREVTAPRSVGATAKNDKYYFEDLFIWLANDCAMGKHFTVDQVELLHLEKFQSKLLIGWEKRKPLKANSINRKFNTYRAFFNTCVKWGLIAKSPVTGMKWLGELEPDIKLPEDGIVEAAIGKVPEWASRVLLFLKETGRRPVDAERANVEDFRPEDGGIWIASFKGGKASRQFFPLSDVACDLCNRLISEAKRKFRARPADPLFADDAGRRIRAGRLGRELRNAGFCAKTGLTAYRLRHAFIDGLVDMGVHQRDVQLLAGHKKWETTTKYTHRRVDHLREIVNERSVGREGKQVKNRSNSSKDATCFDLKET